MAIKSKTGGAILSKTTAPPFDVDALFETEAERAIEYHSTNALVIGEQATWKTASTATIPQKIVNPKTGVIVDAKVLFIDDDGRSNVINRAKVPHFKFLKIPYDPENNQRTWEQINAIISNLNEHKDGWDFNVGVFDTLTPLDMMLWDLSYTPPPIGVGVDRLTKKDEAYSITMYDTDYTHGADKNYEFVKREMRRILFSFMHRFDYFFVLCHSKAPFFGDIGSAKEKWTPDVKGGMKDLLPKLFQEVYFTVKGNDGTWCWQTAPANKKYARTCLPIPSIVPQDYSILTNNNWQRYIEHPVTVSEEEV